MLVRLAVSGGVDSMALAGLWASMRRQVNDSPRVSAFIVDHDAREESAAEARRVASALEDQGISSHVLTLQWPRYIQPPDLSNFESEARRLRYQALGRACRDADPRITSLFVGHHQDDQAETVLMRLANGHRGIGLEGMRGSSDIPECHGQYGVHASGDARVTQGTALTHPSLRGMRTPFRIEGGGVRIYRPLLSFAKERLIATCEEQGMPWFEDATNQNPALTPRNAIRQLLASHHLPKALQKASLLRLSERMSTASARQEKLSKHLLDACHISSFDLRAGTLDFSLPRPLPLYIRQDEPQAREICAAFLRRLLDPVSPHDGITLAKLSTAKLLDSVPPLAERSIMSTGMVE
ncbi:MAG: hypothetical protein M1838_003974 [Thelocarpon superellum]|nr:MAG: hypothetical protein M1838_003974 [Thelocarpon superellum]